MSEIKFDFSPLVNDPRLCYAIKEIQALSDRDRQRLLSAMYKDPSPVTITQLISNMTVSERIKLIKKLLDSLPLRE